MVHVTEEFHTLYAMGVVMWIFMFFANMLYLVPKYNNKAHWVNLFMWFPCMFIYAIVCNCYVFRQAGKTCSLRDQIILEGSNEEFWWYQGAFLYWMCITYWIAFGVMILMIVFVVACYKNYQQQYNREREMIMQQMQQNPNQQYYY